MSALPQGIFCEEVPLQLSILYVEPTAHREGLLARFFFSKIDCTPLSQTLRLEVSETHVSGVQLDKPIEHSEASVTSGEVRLQAYEQLPLGARVQKQVEVQLLPPLLLIHSISGSLL